MATEHIIRFDTDKSSCRYTYPITDMEKIQQMCSYLDTGLFKKRNYLLFVIGVTTGLSISTYLDYTIHDFKEFCSLGYETIEKYSGKGIDIKIKDDLISRIEDYVRDREDEEYMFSSSKGGTPIKRQTVWYILNEAAKKAGIDQKIGSTVICKTFCYWYYKDTNDSDNLMKLFGFTKLTDLYNYIQTK